MERALLPGQISIDLLIDEIINQIDKNRGDMDRLEFASLLIRIRLEKYCYYSDEEKLYGFIKEVLDMLSLYLESFFFEKIKKEVRRRQLNASLLCEMPQQKRNERYYKFR